MRSTPYQYPDITHSIYYRMVPRLLRKCPLVFWGGVSAILTAVALFLLSKFGESLSAETVIAFCSLFALIPMSHIEDYRRFYKLMENFVALFELNSEEREHIWTKTNKIFVLRNPIMWVTAILTNVLCTAMLTYLDLPFRSNLLNVLAIIGFEFVVFFGGQSVYTTLADLRLLSEFASISPRTRFFKSFPLRLQEFSTGYYLRSSLHILLSYVAILIMVIRGPYGVSSILMLLLVVVALLPTSYIVYFLFQIHRVMLALKQRNLDVIDEEIRSLWNGKLAVFQANGSTQPVLKNELLPEKLKTMECIGKLLDLRERVTRMRDWPWDIQGSIGLFISTLIGVVQVVVAVLPVLKP